MNYDKLVKALRCEGLSKECDSCGYGYRLCPDSECNDACDRMKLENDAAAAIEELQAELAGSKDAIRILKHNLEMKKPKRGEWKPFDLTYGRSIYSCSVCEQATEVPMCMEKPMYAYCPNCGVKMNGEQNVE